MNAFRDFRIRLGLIAVCALCCLGALPYSSSAAPASTVKLTLLYTNDVHGHLLPFDYDDLGTQLTDAGGAARRAALIRRLRAEAGNPVLVMDAGDVFQRGPLSDLKGVPDFAVMNAVPYDVMTLGNNEFKSVPGPEALDTLKKRIGEAAFTIVSANVFDLGTGKRLVQPYRIFEFAGVKVAVLGLLTSRDSKLPEFAGVRVDDPIIAARLMVPELRKQADYVIALTHIGVARDLELASSVPGIDVIIGGDSHTWLFQPLLVQGSASSAAGAINGTIVCQDGEWGRTVGKLDLTLSLSANGGYSTSSYTRKLIEVDSTVKPAADIEAIIDKSAKPFRTGICKLSKGIKASAAADWVAARMREVAASDVAIEPRSEVEQGLDAGGVTALDVRAMFPFASEVDKVTITGKQLKSFVAEEPDSALAGVTLSDGELLIGGRKLTDSRTYTIAVSDYYAKHSPALLASPFVPLHKTTADIVTQYLFLHFSRN